MPRVLTTVIVTAFWLVMTGLLVKREVVPYVVSRRAPTYEEMLSGLTGRSEEKMGVYRSGERVGESCVTKSRREDFGYAVSSVLVIKDAVPFFGRMTSLDLRMDVNFDSKKQLEDVEVYANSVVKLHLKGKIEGETLVLRSIGGLKIPPLAVPYSADEMFQHSFLPITGSSGLKVGQKWRLRLFGGLLSEVAAAEVEVVAIEPIDVLGRTVEAFRLEQRLIGKESQQYVTWVARDGTVLKQMLPMGLMLVKEDLARD